MKKVLTLISIIGGAIIALAAVAVFLSGSSYSNSDEL